MTPAEFKAARRELKYTAAALASRWGMGKQGGRTVRAWESEANKQRVNPIAAYCIRMMLDANDVAPPKPPRQRPTPKPRTPKPKKTKLEKRVAKVEQDRETRMLARAMRSIKLPE